MATFVSGNFAGRPVVVTIGDGGIEHAEFVGESNTVEATELVRELVGLIEETTAFIPTMAIRVDVNDLGRAVAGVFEWLDGDPHPELTGDPVEQLRTWLRSEDDSPRTVY